MRGAAHVLRAPEAAYFGGGPQNVLQGAGNIFHSPFNTLQFPPHGHFQAKSNGPMSWQLCGVTLLLNLL
jgi:hypothetical protein